MEKCSASTNTKNVINPRVEIDTSAPFESVKEAVDMFSSRGQWNLASDHHDAEVITMEKLDEQATQLEKDLILKERQTLQILKELEAAKAFVKDLKFQANVANDQYSSNPVLSRGLMFVELSHAKSTLSKTTSDLECILASVESLNKRMSLEADDALHENRAKTREAPYPMELFSRGVLSFEADQFKKMMEASRYEVMKAASEIERMKTSIKMAEMRLSAAKKMEEAAKAVKAIAITEFEASSDIFELDDGITLSFEEHRVLMQKAKQAGELCKKKFADRHRTEVPVMEKFEEMTVKENENGFSMFKFRNSYRSPSQVLKANDSIDKNFTTNNKVAVVERKNCSRSETPHVSLSQLLKKQSRLILHDPTKPTIDGNVVKKQYFVQRKKFGFIQVPIPTVQSKKKMQSVKD